jgi:hypothetical protein
VVRDIARILPDFFAILRVIGFYFYTVKILLDGSGHAA